MGGLNLRAAARHRLRERNKAHRATGRQEELAELADLHTSYVGLLERGHRNPTVYALYKLAGALDTTLASLVEEFQESLSR